MSTADREHMIDCFLCRRQFQFGPHIYNGERIRAWDIMVCRTCKQSNWDGIVPSHFPHLLEHLKARGIEAHLNVKGWIEWPQ